MHPEIQPAFEFPGTQKSYVWFISGWLLDTYRLGLWVGVGQMVLIKTTMSQAFFLKFKIAEKWTFFMSAFAFFAHFFSKYSYFGTNQDTDFKPTSNGLKSPISDNNKISDICSHHGVFQVRTLVSYIFSLIYSKIFKNFREILVQVNKAVYVFAICVCCTEDINE